MLISELMIAPQSGGHVIEMAETRLLPVFNGKNYIVNEFGDSSEFVSRVGNKVYHPDVGVRYDIADWMVNNSLAVPGREFDFTSFKVHRVPARLQPYVITNNIWNDGLSGYYKNYQWDKQVDFVYGFASDAKTNTMAFHYPRADSSGDVSIGIVNLKTGGMMHNHTARYYVNKDAPPGRLVQATETGLGGWGFINPDNTLKIFLDDGSIIASTTFGGTLPEFIPIKDSPLFWQTNNTQNWAVAKGVDDLPRLVTKPDELGDGNAWLGFDLVFPGGCIEVLRVIPPKVTHIGDPDENIYSNDGRFWVVYVRSDGQIAVGTVINPNEGDGARSIVDVTTTTDIGIGSIAQSGNVRPAVSGHFYGEDYLYISFSSFGSQRFSSLGGSYPATDGSDGYYLAMVQIPLVDTLSTPSKFLKMSTLQWRVTKNSTYVSGGHVEGDIATRNKHYDIYRSYDCSFFGVGGGYAGLRIGAPLYSRDYLRLGFGPTRTVLDGSYIPDPVLHYGGIPPSPEEFSDGLYHDDYTLVTQMGRVANFTVVAQGVSGIDVIEAPFEFTAEMNRAVNGVTSRVGMGTLLASLFSGQVPAISDESPDRNVDAYPIPTNLSNAFKEFGGLGDSKESPSVFTSNPAAWAQELSINVIDVNYADFNLVLRDVYGNVSAGVISRTPAGTQYAEIVYSGSMGSDGAMSEFGAMLAVPNLGAYHIKVK